MPDKSFIDTNILVYAFDNSSPEKKQKSISILKQFYISDDYLISSQVINEFLLFYIRSFEHCFIKRCFKTIRDIKEDKIKSFASY